MKYRLLRLLLLGLSLAWLLGIAGLVMPWPTTLFFLESLGAGTIPADPMLEYWGRMAAGIFTGVGVILMMLANRPTRFPGLLPFVGILTTLEGLILLVVGLKNHLPPLPFCPGTILCLIFGTGIWILRKETSDKSMDCTSQ